MWKPTLKKDEKILLKIQGSIEMQQKWQLGHLYLTDQRIFFIQVKRKIFELDLERIIGSCIVKRYWLLGVKVSQLGICYQIDGEKRKVFIALAKPKKMKGDIERNVMKMLVERRGYNGRESKPQRDPE